MNVLRLDPTTFLPDMLIEHYSTMIWNERYSDASEFEMHTAQIDLTRDLIPEGSLISIVESDEVMFVEDYEIDKDDDGNPTCKITGRSFETFLENRALEAIEYNVPWKAIKQYTPMQMIAYLAWNFLDNATGQDPSRTGRTQNALQAVPNVSITDGTSVVGTLQDWWLAQGEVYAALKDILTLTGYGIRPRRPGGRDGYVMSFDTSGGASRGNASRVWTPGLTGLQLDIYNGNDRTSGSTAFPEVVFDYSRGDIDDPKYLISIKDFKNAASVASSIGVTQVGPGWALSGLDQRVLYFDDGDIGDQVYADYVGAISQNGLIALAKHNRMIAFDGAISLLSSHIYGEDYFLGDVVTLRAEYGVTEDMFVSEYIRTEDAEGDRGYPTLTLIS